MSDAYFRKDNQPIDVPLRPLVKGVIKDRNPHLLQVGEFVDCKNFDVTDNGLKRRNGLEAYTLDAVDYPPITSMTTLFDSGDSQHTVITDSKFLYEVTLEGLTPKYWEFSSGLVTASGAFVFGEEGASFSSGAADMTMANMLVDTGATFETDGVIVGDLVKNTTDATEAEVTAVTSETVLGLASDIFISGENYTIHHQTKWGDNQILAGDMFVIDPLGAGDGPEEILISSVSDDDDIILDSSVVGDYSLATAYTIRRAFSIDDPYKLSWTHVDDKIVYADGSRPLYTYDGTDFGAFDDDLEFIPKGVYYYKDRLWCFNTVENSIKYRHRLRWTTPTDHTAFIGSPDTQWIDRPYSQGEFMALTSLGDLMIAMYTDRIEIGRVTSYAGNTLPYYFAKLETGFVGIVGMHAFTSFLDSVFFVGQNDVYRISPDASITKIGSAVTEATVDIADNLFNTEVVHDSKNSRIIFAFPIGSTTPNELWNYWYKHNAWTYSALSAENMSVNNIVTGYFWDDLSGLISPDDWSGMDVFPSWNSIHGSDTRAYLYLSVDGLLYRLQDNLTQDSGDVPITGIIESGDFDFGALNIDKTLLRFSMRLKSPVTALTQFTLSGSVDNGVTYRTLGVLTFPIGRQEGYLDFRLTGSALRYKLETGSIVEPYEILEHVLRIKGRGIEQGLT